MKKGLRNEVKGYRDYWKRGLKEEFLLHLLFLISVISCIIDEFSNIEINRIVLSLLLSYIASYVFYLLNIAFVKTEKRIRSELYLHLNFKRIIDFFIKLYFSSQYTLKLNDEEIERQGFYEWISEIYLTSEGKDIFSNINKAINYKSFNLVKKTNYYNDFISKLRYGIVTEEDVRKLKIEYYIDTFKIDIDIINFINIFLKEFNDIDFNLYNKLYNNKKNIRDSYENAIENNNKLKEQVYSFFSILDLSTEKFYEEFSCIFPKKVSDSPGYIDRFINYIDLSKELQKCKEHIEKERKYISKFSIGYGINTCNCILYSKDKSYKSTNFQKIDILKKFYYNIFSPEPRTKKKSLILRNRCSYKTQKEVTFVKFDNEDIILFEIKKNEKIRINMRKIEAFISLGDVESRYKPIISWNNKFK